MNAISPESLSCRFTTNYSLKLLWLWSLLCWQGKRIWNLRNETWTVSLTTVNCFVQRKAGLGIMKLSHWWLQSFFVCMNSLACVCINNHKPVRPAVSWLPLLRESSWFQQLHPTAVWRRRRVWARQLQDTRRKWNNCNCLLLRTYK